MEMFVSFSEVAHFFKRTKLRFVITVLLIGIIFGLAPLKLVKPKYTASTSFVMYCGVPDNVDSDYHLQYTNILYSRVQSAVALALENQLPAEAAQRVGVSKSLISSITAEQENSSPVVKLTLTSTDASKAAPLSDAAAEILAEQMVKEFPSPQLTATVVDKAIPVAAKSRKSTMVKDGILGLIVGFIIYFCAGIIAVITDKTVRNGSFTAENLHTRLLAEIPKAEDKKDDSFRRLRAAALKQGKDKKSFLVTNASGYASAASVAAGFARALSLGGKHVLLVDADFRAPMVSKIFGLQTEKTTLDVLNGSCAIKDAVKPVNGIDVLAAVKDEGSDPSDIFAGGAFGKLLKDAEADYDCVVIAAPPESKYPDAQSIAGLPGCVVLTAKYGSTPYNELKASFERLKTAGGNLIGIVTTDN